MRHPIRDGILIFFLAYFIVISYFQSVHHRRAIEAAKNAEQSVDPDARVPAAAASANSDVLSLPGAAAVDGEGSAGAAEKQQEQQEKQGQEEDQQTTVVVPGHHEPTAAAPGVDSTTVRSTSTSAAPEVGEREAASGDQGVPVDTTVVVGTPVSRGSDRPGEDATTGDQEGPLGAGGGVAEPETAEVTISGSSGEAEGLRPLVNEGDQAADREGEGLRPLAEDVGEGGEGGKGQGEEGSAAADGGDPTGRGGGMAAVSSEGRSPGGSSRVSRVGEGRAL